MTLPDPQPYPGDVVALTDGVAHHLEYRDSLGRPMKGTVTITGKTKQMRGGVIIAPVSVSREVIDGVLDVVLSPDIYVFEASLSTVEGKSWEDRSTIVIGPDPVG